MDSKKIVMFGAMAGMTVGGLVPTLFGASAFGGWSILAGLVGGIIGIWLGVKVGKQLG